MIGILCTKEGGSMPHGSHVKRGFLYTRLPFLARVHKICFDANGNVGVVFSMAHSSTDHFLLQENSVEISPVDGKKSMCPANLRQSCCLEPGCPSAHTCCVELHVVVCGSFG